MANNTGTVLDPSLGSVLKINVTADIGNGLHLSDADFKCTFYSDAAVKKELVVEKGSMLIVDEDNYFAIVNTSVIGTGKYYCKMEIDIPDSDVEGGTRKEIVRFPVSGCKVIK